MLPHNLCFQWCPVSQHVIQCSIRPLCHLCQRIPSVCTDAKGSICGGSTRLCALPCRLYCREDEVHKEIIWKPLIIACPVQLVPSEPQQLRHRGWACCHSSLSHTCTITAPRGTCRHLASAALAASMKASSKHGARRGTRASCPCRRAARPPAARQHSVAHAHGNVSMQQHIHPE